MRRGKKLSQTTLRRTIRWGWRLHSLRAAAATSNFMIGVTAVTSAYVYWGRGDVRVDIAAPLVAGVFAGSLLGARISPKIRPVYILMLLVGIAGWLSVQMIYKLFAGGF